MIDWLSSLETLSFVLVVRGRSPGGDMKATMTSSCDPRDVRDCCAVANELTRQLWPEKDFSIGTVQLQYATKALYLAE